VPDEDPSSIPWVYEQIIVSWLTRSLANTLLTRIFELDTKDQPHSPHLGSFDPDLDILKYRAFDCMSIAELFG
jgi:hypothetical protein